MSWQIIKQPDGHYAIWSTIVDDLIILNCTRDQILQVYLDDVRARIEHDVDQVIEQLEHGGKPYHQFTMTWDEALAAKVEKQIRRRRKET